MEIREDQAIRINHIQARGFITKGEKILVMFRRKNGEEYYVFPGGHMQIGETPEQTCAREITEETTVVVKDLKLAYEIESESHKGKKEKEYYFTGEWESGEPVLSGEESRRASADNYFEPMWIEKSKLNDLLIYPAHAKEWILNY